MPQRRIEPTTPDRSCQGATRCLWRHVEYPFHTLRMAGGISDNTGADARGGGDEIGDTFEERALAGGIAELDAAELDAAAFDTAEQS